MESAGDVIENVLKKEPGKWFTTTEIRELTGFQSGRVSKAMRQLVVRNIVDKEISESNQIFYRINPSETRAV